MANLLLHRHTDGHLAVVEVPQLEPVRGGWEPIGLGVPRLSQHHSRVAGANDAVGRALIAEARLHEILDARMPATTTVGTRIVEAVRR